MKKLILETITAANAPNAVNKELVRQDNDAITKIVLKKRCFTVSPKQKQPIQSRKIFSLLDIVELLSEIEELDKFEVGIRPDGDGVLLVVGNNTYELSDDAELVVL